MHIGTQEKDGLNVWVVGMAIGVQCHLDVITGVNRLAVIHTRPLIKTIRPIMVKNVSNENGPIASIIGK
jgi:hypothetical protein